MSTQPPAANDLTIRQPQHVATRSDESDSDNEIAFGASKDAVVWDADALLRAVPPKIGKDVRELAEKVKDGAKDLADMSMDGSTQVTKMALNAVAPSVASVTGPAVDMAARSVKPAAKQFIDPKIDASVDRSATVSADVSEQAAVCAINSADASIRAADKSVSKWLAQK